MLDPVDMVDTVDMVSTAWGLVQGRNRPHTVAWGLAAVGPFLGHIHPQGVFLCGELPGVGHRWVWPSRIHCSLPFPSRPCRSGKCQSELRHPLRPRLERQMREPYICLGLTSR
jgi:hypothetical protein